MEEGFKALFESKSKLHIVWNIDRISQRLVFLDSTGKLWRPAEITPIFFGIMPEAQEWEPELVSASELAGMCVIPSTEVGHSINNREAPSLLTGAQTTPVVILGFNHPLGFPVELTISPNNWAMLQEI